MAENNAKNYEGGTKGLGSVKTDVVSPALQKLTELSVKLRALTDNILEIKAKNHYNVWTQIIYSQKRMHKL